MVRQKSSRTRYWLNLSLFLFVTLFVVAITFSAYLAHKHAMVFVYPGRTQPHRTPADVGLEDWLDVSFPSTDGIQINAWFIPVNSETPSPILIYVHGLGSNREGLLDQAKLLYDHGYSALLLDLRNHGDSKGDITTMGLQEILDVEGAVDFLIGQPEVDSDRIGLVGHSLGGAIVIRAAAHIPLVKATIAESAFTSLEDNIEQGVREMTGLPSFPFAPMIVWFGEREAGAKIHLVRPIDDLEKIATRAILFIHGEQDTLVDVSNSRNLFDAAKEPKEIYIIPNAGHGGLVEADPEEFEKRVVTFLDLYLK